MDLRLKKDQSVKENKVKISLKSVNLIKERDQLFLNLKVGIQVLPQL